jgi:hypothetical protein
MTPTLPSPSIPGVPSPRPACSPPIQNMGPPPEQTTRSSPPTPGIPTWPTKDPVGGNRPDSGRQDDDTQPPAARIHELRAALSVSTNRRLQLARTVPLHCGRRSRGPTWSAIQVQAFCQCGWVTHWQPWTSDPTAAAAALHMIDAALEDHTRQIGHRPFPHDGIPEVDGYYQRCGWLHGFQDACPIPPDSPAGQMTRICGLPTLGDPFRSLDRLAAIEELRTWLDDQQLQAIIGARLAGCAWPDIAVAAGVTTQDATAKWGAVIGRYEALGLLAPHPDDPRRHQDSDGKHTDVSRTR